MQDYTGNFIDVIKKLIVYIQKFANLYIIKKQYDISYTMYIIISSLNKINILISKFQNMGLKFNIKYEDIKILIEKFNLYVKQKNNLTNYYIKRVQYNDIEIQRQEELHILLQKLNDFKLEEKLNETFSKVNLTFKDSKTRSKTRSKTTSKASGKTNTRKKTH